MNSARGVLDWMFILFSVRILRVNTEDLLFALRLSDSYSVIHSSRRRSLLLNLWRIWMRLSLALLPSNAEYLSEILINKNPNDLCWLRHVLLIRQSELLISVVCYEPVLSLCCWPRQWFVWRVGGLVVRGWGCGGRGSYLCPFHWLRGHWLFTVIASFLSLDSTD